MGLPNNYMRNMTPFDIGVALALVNYDASYVSDLVELVVTDVQTVHKDEVRYF